ncbi:hypothetical protein [Burkholderia sp. Ax-1719]|uniref:hypothetical protein n=1 Tax=Burkholderia sp. Ax-1719 TaxID=2608334 RepID=UPI0031F5D0E7
MDALRVRGAHYVAMALYDLNEIDERAILFPIIPIVPLVAIWLHGVSVAMFWFVR